MTLFNCKFTSRKSTGDGFTVGRFTGGILAAMWLASVCGNPATADQWPTDIAADGIPAGTPGVQAALPRYLQSRSAQFVDWLSDGSMLISTRFADTNQIHRLRAPLGMREQISFPPDGVADARARPVASDGIAYVTPRHGDEGAQLFLQRFDNHELTALTDGSHRDGTPVWAHDGRHLAFASNRVNGLDVEIYELDSDSPSVVPRLLAGGAGNQWHILDWSIDDRRLLLGRNASGSASSPDLQLFIVERASGEIAAVSSGVAGPRKGSAVPVQAREARFAPDGHGIVLITDQLASGSSSGSTGTFHRLAYFDLHDQSWRDLSTASAHEVERFDQSSDGHYVAYTLNENGADRLMLIDQTLKLDMAVTQVPPGVIDTVKFDPANQRLALSVQSTRHAGDVYVYELQTHLLTEWTGSEAGPVNVDDFALPATLQFPTWDRVDGRPRELSALVYRSLLHADTITSPRPVVIVLCSGGGAQCRPGFEPFLQYLVNELDVVVVAPNVRGSGGYGGNLEQAGTGELRDDAIRDVGSLLVWIDLQKGLDRNRVAIIGEGFGSYLALQSLAAYGDRLRGAVAAFPPHHSALGHAAEIRRPLLLVQGLNNPAAPAYEMDGLRARLRAAEVEVQSLNASNEGAAFVRKSDRDAYLSAAAEFLSRLLR